MLKSSRSKSIVFFAFFSGWLLAVPFQGQVLHMRMADAGILPSSLFTNLIMVAHFIGLLISGWLARSIVLARKWMLVAMNICLSGTLVLLFPWPSLWYPIVVIVSISAGLAIGSWGWYYKEFTLPGKKLQTAAIIIIAGNLLMIFQNIIAIILSPVVAIILSIIFLFVAVLFCFQFKSVQLDQERETNENKKLELGQPLALLCVFIGFITINSGMMYQVVLPEFAHLELLIGIYWAIPYMGTLGFMIYISERFNKSYILYIAVIMIGVAYVLYFTLDRSPLSFIVIDTFLLAALGVCDLFWWTILGEMLTFSQNPARIFGIGLSANIIGVLLGIILGESLSMISLTGIHPTTIAVSIVFITLIGLPLLYNELSVTIKNNTFLMGLSRHRMESFSEREDWQRIDDIWKESETQESDGDNSTAKRSEVPEKIIKIYLKKRELTGREIEVAQVLLTGATYRMIAQELNISENTVKTHIKNIYSKLDVQNKTEFISLIRTI